MNELQPILDVAVPQIAAILVSVIGSVVLGLWGHTQVWARKRLGVEMDALDRETLDAAIMTGIRMLAARSPGITQAMEARDRVDFVLGHVNGGGATDAVKRLKAPEAAVRNKIEAMLGVMGGAS